ncbi:hypothetical protein [Nocardiopsis tropica]|uniref:Uncharacterized protein n=1 Tax=Nocardiopsis tropica TaxID=109330 RepID=A0ABU7KMU5_9ACTN|nr:hypothetical protein [Nocardiopsis umidischolae]MEE2050599.1 hypothetical protein [Nocardiopsis umidischolae]
MGSAHPTYDDGYVDVDTRLAAFLTAHPEGALRPLDPTRPYRVERIEGTDERGRSVVTTFLVYTAAAYRSPDDQLPGVGIAWTPFPGRTEYTLDTELQNVETSAWGRAIRAVMPTGRPAPAHRSPAQAEPLTPRQINGLRTRAAKRATPELLAVLTAEIDEFLAHDRLTQDVADELRELARARKERLTAPTKSSEDKKTQLSVVGTQPEKLSPSASDNANAEDQRTRAERIAAKHGTAPRNTKKNKQQEDQ